MALTVDVQVNGYAICGQPLGMMYAYASGGTAPYSYMWSTGENTPQLAGLAAGIYQVTVTDAMGEEATGSGTIENVNSYPYSTVVPGYSCIGDYSRAIFYRRYRERHAAATRDRLRNMVQVRTPSSRWAMPLPGRNCPMPARILVLRCHHRWCSTRAVVTVNYTDGSGCPGTFDIYLPPLVDLPEMQVLSTTGSCTNSSIGSATISVGAAPMNSGLPVKLKTCRWHLRRLPLQHLFHRRRIAQRDHLLEPGTWHLLCHGQHR